MVYAMFVCTFVAMNPHAPICHLQGAVADPAQVLFQDKEKCEQAAAQKNAVWHDKPGATVWARYVCLDKPAAQPVPSAQ